LLTHYAADVGPDSPALRFRRRKRNPNKPPRPRARTATPPTITGAFEPPSADPVAPVAGMALRLGEGDIEPEADGTALSTGDADATIEADGPAD